MLLELPELVLRQICMTAGTSVLKAFSESCAKKHQEVVQNVITADKRKLRRRLCICATFAKFRDALIRQLPDGHNSKQCKDVQKMTEALVNLNNDLNMYCGGWKQWNEVYGWTVQQIQVLTTIGGNQKFAWEVREQALLYLEDSERDDCQRVAQYLQRLKNRARMASAEFFAAGHEESVAFREYQHFCSRHIKLQCEAAIVAGDHRWLTQSAPENCQKPRFFYLECGSTTPYAPSDSHSDSDF